MAIWQSDLWHDPHSKQEDKKWLLLICDRQGKLIHQATCPQSEVNSHWLLTQLELASHHSQPEKMEIFRPQVQGLFTQATSKLSIPLVATRRTPQIKEAIRQYQQQNDGIISGTNYLALDKPPPENLPEKLWGENWHFVSMLAGEIIDFASDRPLPVCNLPKSVVRANSLLHPETKIPGIAIDGGRKSLVLTQWLAAAKPFSLNYIPTEIGKSGGLILEAGLVERWILATFDSAEVATAAKNYQQAKQASQGVHFLLVQPDDSGMTHTGFWLLQDQ